LDQLGGGGGFRARSWINPDPGLTVKAQLYRTRRVTPFVHRRIRKERQSAIDQVQAITNPKRRLARWARLILSVPGRVKTTSTGSITLVRGRIIRLSVQPPPQDRPLFSLEAQHGLTPRSKTIRVRGSTSFGRNQQRARSSDLARSRKSSPSTNKARFQVPVHMRRRAPCFPTLPRQ
jgi:hypothetical protein